MGAREGKKYDAGKLEWDLLPLESLETVIEVLMFGKEKYDEDNWRYVDHMDKRYWNAALRHLTEWKNAVKNINPKKYTVKDNESGINHLAHAAACILFLLAECDGVKSEEISNRLDSYSKVPGPNELER